MEPLKAEPINEEMKLPLVIKLKMKKTDVVILTDSRYVLLDNPSDYEQNILDEDNYIKEALEEEGLIVKRKSWDDQNYDWAKASFLLFRTTWDYFDRYEEFSSWLSRVSNYCDLLNPKSIISWNIDKHYLIDLEEKGIHCAATQFIEIGSDKTLSEIQKQYHWQEMVLKPCVSGGAWHTYKFSANDLPKYEVILKSLIEKNAMMLQPFQKNIVEKGEISMMVMGGKYTHAVIKMAKKGDFRVQDDFGGTVALYEPSNDEIAFAESAVAACNVLPAYARVDIFEDNEGKIALSELELIEPELWFRLYPEAAVKLAKHIKQRYF